MTIEDAMTQALLNGHVMTTLAADPVLTWATSTCRACGLLLPGALGRALAPRGRLEPGGVPNSRG